MTTGYEFQDQEREAVRGAALLDKPLELATLRANAAVDQEVNLPDFQLLAGKTVTDALGEEDRVEVVDVLGEGPQDVGREWHLAPIAEHRRGYWANEQGARLGNRAATQLCQLAGIPRRLIRKMPARLQNINMNWAIQRNLERSGNLLRLSTISSDGRNEDFRLRAILSKKYRAIDDVEVFDTLGDILQDYPGAELRGACMEDEFTRLSIVMEDLDLGDSKAKLGVVVTNSEVGSASLTVAGFMFRVKCNNGWVTVDQDDRYSFRHTGDADRDMAPMLQQAFAGSLEHAKSTGQDYMDALNMRLLDPQGEIAKLAKGEKLSQRGLDALLASFDEEPHDSVAGVSNAVTRTAQQVANPQRAYELEIMGASYLRQAVAERRQGAAA